MRFCNIREEDGTVPAAECRLCGDTIYQGEEYYHINGEDICCGCLERFAAGAFGRYLCTGGERI